MVTWSFLCDHVALPVWSRGVLPVWPHVPLYLDVWSREAQRVWCNERRRVTVDNKYSRQFSVLTPAYPIAV